MKEDTIQELILYGITNLIKQLKTTNTVYVKLPQYGDSEKSVGFEKGDYLSCREVKGGSVITLKQGHEIWTSANYDIVMQLIELHTAASID